MDAWYYSKLAIMERAERLHPGLVARYVKRLTTGLWADVVMFNPESDSLVTRRLFF